MSAQPHRWRSRKAFGTGVTVLAVAAASCLQATAPAQADPSSTITAANDAELGTALATAATSSGTTTILLTADFATAGQLMPGHSDGTLVIDGQGHTLSFNDEHSGLELFGSSVTVTDVALSAGMRRGPALSITATTTAAIDNVWASASGGADGSSLVKLDAGSSASIWNSVIRDWEAADSSGVDAAAWVRAADDVMIVNSTFSNNTALTCAGARINAPSTTVLASLFNENSGGVAGGLCTLGTVTIEDSLFAQNEGASAGAVYATEATIKNSEFAENSSQSLGGAVVASARLDILRSSFIANHAGQYGGAAASTDVHVLGSTFFENEAGLSGGALASQGNMDVRLSTFYANTANDANGAGTLAAMSVGTPTTATLAGNIIDAGGAKGCSFEGSLTSLGANVDTGGDCTASWSGPGDVTGLTGALLADLLSAGRTDSAAPHVSSPAVDLVPGALCTSLLGATWNDSLEDQRGYDRALASAAGACDAGAVELPRSTATVATPAGDVQVNVLGALGAGDDCSALATAVPTPTGVPAGVATPLGGVSICAKTRTRGAELRITLTLPRPATELWKVQDGQWAQPPATISSGGLVVVYDAVEGGKLDDDGVENRQFIDPVVAGVSGHFTG